MCRFKLCPKSSTESHSEVIALENINYLIVLFFSFIVTCECLKKKSGATEGIQGRVKVEVCFLAPSTLIFFSFLFLSSFFFFFEVLVIPVAVFSLIQ